MKTVNVFLGEPEADMLADIQGFIERNGKPCCLNLITDRDNKFLKELEKKASEQVAAEGGDHPPTQKEEPEDELEKIIKAEEEEAQKKEAWLKHKAARDVEEEAKR